MMRQGIATSGGLAQDLERTSQRPAIGEISSLLCIFPRECKCLGPVAGSLMGQCELAHNFDACDWVRNVGPGGQTRLEQRAGGGPVAEGSSETRGARKEPGGEGSVDC